MKSSELLIKKIKEFEGFVPLSYKCPAGVWTVGYGHIRGVYEGIKVTEEEAEELLKEDLQQYEKYVNNLGICKTQGQFDALVDFAFNLGTASLGSSTLLKKIRDNESELIIRREFSRWVYAGGEVMKGLVKRRKWEADRFFS